MRSIALLALLLGCIAPRPAVANVDPRSIQLVDQNGTRFTLDDLRGAPVLVTFVATRCSDICPIATALYSRLDERLRRSRMRVRLLEVTLDPNYDTPFIMERYAESYGVHGARWRLASGSPSNVRALMRAFGITAQKNRKGVPEVHSSFVYLVDARGRLARTFLLSTSLVDEALHALRAAIAYRPPAG